MTARDQFKQIRSLNLLHLALAIVGAALLVSIDALFSSARGEVAILWLPNAFLTAIILRKAPGEAAVVIVLCGAASAAVCIALKDSASHALGQALCNCFEVALIYFVLRRLVSKCPDLTDFHTLAWFSVIGGLVAPAIAATLAVIVLGLSDPKPVGDAWLEWAMANGIGMLIAAPTMAVLFQSGSSWNEWTRKKAIDWFVIFGGGAAITAWIFYQTSYPFLFGASLFVLLAAFRLGMSGAAASILLVTSLAGIALYFNSGPFSLAEGDFETKVFVFQVFVACTFAGALPIAAALAIRTRLQHELGESRDFAQSILNEMREVVFRTDAEGRFSFLNPAWEELSGFTVSESIGLRLKEHLLEADRSIAEREYAKLVADYTDRLQLFLAFVRADGEIRHLEIQMSAVRSTDRTLIGTIGNGRDVTEARKAQHALASSEKRFQVLANLSPAGIFRTALDGACTYVNDAWLGFAGLEQAEAMGFGWTAAIHPDDVDWLSESWAKAVESGERFQAEFRFRRPKDRSVIWARAVAAPEYDQEGKTSGFIGVCIDFTDIVETQRTLERERSQFRYLAENSTDAIITVGADGICRYASPAMKELTGYSPEEVIGKPVSIPINDADLQGLLRAIEQLQSGEIKRAVVSYRAQHKGGEWRWHESSIRAVQDPVTGEVVETVSLVRDIEERKRLEEELRAALEASQAATRAKSSFLANMSHEIRTPMNGVVGFADMLVDSALDPLHRQYAELISESARSLVTLIDDILDFSKIEAGQMSIAAEPFEIHHMIEGTVRLMRAAATQKNLDLKTEYGAGTMRTIVGDKLRIRQIVSNFLGNAIKFTEKGSVGVHTRIYDTEGGQQLEIAVYDTGIGIPEDRQSAIFAEFEQAEESTTRRFGGTGLGLAISQRLAMLMNGNLTVESTPGSGSTFTLRIPITAAREEVAPQPSRDPPPLQPNGAHERSRRRILVAEDHDINRMLVTAMLDRSGYDHEHAEDGNEAIRMIEAAFEADMPFDLVLMDMQMPGMDGLEATRRIRAAGIPPSRLPIIALTANAFQSDVDECIDAGMQAHVAKPIQLHQLTEALDTWTAHKSKGQAPDKAAKGIDALRPRYEAFKGEALGKLDECSNAVPRPSADQLEELQELIHKLAGSAGMFGEPEVSDTASRLESAIKSHAMDGDDELLKEVMGYAQAMLAVINAS